MGIMAIMETQKQIKSDFQDALRSSNEIGKRTLRMVLSSIKLAEIEKGEQLQDTEVLAILRKEIKSRRESIADAERAERPDIAAEAQSEIKILETYLPKSLSDDELEALAKEVIADVEASSLKEIGKVMKNLMPRVQGRADGARVSQVVRDLLTVE